MTAGIIQAAEEYVKNILTHESSGHDWLHIERVRRMAMHIAAREICDTTVVELAALLHEIPDRKIAGVGNEAKALLQLRSWLETEALPSQTIDEILYIIQYQSFSQSGLQHKKLDTIEGQIVQDADRLDALGAIGIARCFAYGGKLGRPIYDPAIPHNPHLTAEEYKASPTSSINHFYEKLLKLKDQMNTDAAKKIAEHRHQFIKSFLEEFHTEANQER